MKRYITLIIIFGVVMPQFVFAAWWNPLSWFDNWTFFKKETREEKLEKRVAELEEQLNNKTTSTPTITPETEKKSIPNLPDPVPVYVPPIQQYAQSLPTNNTPISLASPEEKNFKEATLKAVKNQIDEYQKIIEWIDNDMFPLLNQREKNLKDLISTFKKLRASEPNNSIVAVYSVFIDAYNADLHDIIYFYRDDIFGATKKHIEDKKISKLRTRQSELSEQSLISEIEYEDEMRVLKQYQDNWRELYDTMILATEKYIEQTNKKDAMYQNWWSEVSLAISSLQESQIIENNFEGLYSQQVNNINDCMAIQESRVGFATVKSDNCY